MRWILIAGGSWPASALPKSKKGSSHFLKYRNRPKVDCLASDSRAIMGRNAEEDAQEAIW